MAGYAARRWGGAAGRPAPPTTAATVPEPPPGTVADVLAWVDEDPSTRAAVALAAERARPAPRRTLIAELAELAAAGES